MMKFTLTLFVMAAFVASGLCNVRLDYANRLLGGLSRNPQVQTGLLDTTLSNCLLDCPLGTRCSLEFGTPQCVSDSFAVGLGGYLGVGAGLGHLSNAIGLESTLLGKGNLVGFHRCAPMTPACLATRLDRFEQCRFTFDPRQQRCVRVYVRNICAVFNGPRRNLFSTMVDCEQSCLGRLSY